MDEKCSLPGWSTIRVIGQGSFGDVYEIQRNVGVELEKAALKVISIPQSPSEIEELYNSGCDSESITNTFKNYMHNIVTEYLMMRKLNDCGNVVRCDDLRQIQHDDGIGWDILIRMELLTPMMKALPQQIPEESVIKLGKDLCTALMACKTHGIIHRDIKPQNIFLSENGTFKLGDFGVAKIMERTLNATVVGTYKYMAPEVFHYQPYGSTADIYSLGIVMYWMLNRRRAPFLPQAPAQLNTVLEGQASARRFSGEQIPPPVDGSPWLQRIVLKACAFDPEDRYQSAEEMLRDLEQGSMPAEKPEDPFVQSTQDVGRTVKVNPPAKSQKDTPKPGKRRIWALILAVCLVLVAAATFAGLKILNQRRSAQQEAERREAYDSCIAQAQQETDTDTALELYKQAQEMYPEEEMPYAAYAYTLYEAGRYESCASYIEADLGMGKRFTQQTQNELYEILGAAYFEQEDYAAAASSFRMSAAGGSITVPAMRDYAVSLGRLGDVQAANEIITEMTNQGASGSVIRYVQAEIDYVLEQYLMAEEGFQYALSTTDDSALQRRALRSLAKLYRQCAVLERTDGSPIPNPAQKAIHVLEEGMPKYGLQNDIPLVEMLALAYYDAYNSQPDLPETYLEKSAKYFRQVMDMSIPQEYLYQNLYTIYYKLNQYDQAEEVLLEYRDAYDDSYVPHALRGILLITMENEKPDSQRDYAPAVEEYETAGGMLRSGDDMSYYQQLETLIAQLREKNWIR